LRGLPFSIITSSWSVARTAFQDWHDKRPNLYREVRRRRLALGKMLARAGFALALAYVRHSQARLPRSWVQRS